MIPIDFTTIVDNSGIVPARPGYLLHLDGNTDDDAARALEAGQILVLGGVSMIDDHIVPVVSLTRMHDNTQLCGWTIAVGHPRKALGFEYIELGALVDEIPVPTLMVYFIGRVDRDELATSAAPLEDLLALTRFVMAFIDDNGPPATIDW